jgi:hypothetical protein
MLMWTWRHSAELFVAWLVLALIATAALVSTLRVRRAPVQAGVLLILGILPGFSLVAVTGRTLREMYGSTVMPPWAPVAGTLVLAVLGLGALWFAPGLVVRALRRGYACTAVLIVPLFSFHLTGPHDLLASAGRARSSAVDTCSPVYVLLFDELSYDAAFVDGRARQPALTRLAASATVYHRAQSPAPSRRESSPNTLDAIPQYLNATTPGAVGRGLFGLAQQAGYHTEVVGWYYPYCDVLGSFVDRCRVYSLYNVATMFAHFTPWAPVASVFNIWPYQLPTGLVKRPVAVSVHAGNLDAIVSGAIEPPAHDRVLRWVHFNVPHMPWLAGNGFLSRAAYEPSIPRYEQQVEATDRVLGKVLDGLAARGALETSTILLTSDHGLREDFGGHEPLHVPLVLRTPGGIRRDRAETVQVTDVLGTVVSAACQGT